MEQNQNPQNQPLNEAESPQVGPNDEVALALARISEFASRHWRDIAIIGFDTETSGKYPLTAEICEIAAVKWRNGEIVDTFSTLIRPSQAMGAEVIAIHGITNEMVEGAPAMSERIAEFHAFIQDGVLVAHHAPFDLGFVAIEFEKAGLPFPANPTLCSSLLSRRLFPESTNHRLQTLIPFFGIEQGAAHRALDDAKACLQVGLRCLEKSGAAALSDVYPHQGGVLTWERFSMNEIRKNSTVETLARATLDQAIIEMVYSSGSQPGAARRVHPMGLVRSLDGDFLVAYDEKDQKSKRYLLERVVSAARV